MSEWRVQIQPWKAIWITLCCAAAYHFGGVGAALSALVASFNLEWTNVELERKSDR